MGQSGGDAPKDGQGEAEESPDSHESVACAPTPSAPMAVPLARSGGADRPGSDAAGHRSVGGLPQHETSADGKVSLEPVFCLGNCALAPAVMLDDDIFGKVDADKLEAILE